MLQPAGMPCHDAQSDGALLCSTKRCSTCTVLPAHLRPVGTSPRLPGHRPPVPQGSHSCPPTAQSPAPTYAKGMCDTLNLGDGRGQRHGTCSARPAASPPAHAKHRLCIFSDGYSRGTPFCAHRKVKGKDSDALGQHVIQDLLSIPPAAAVTCSKARSASTVTKQTAHLCADSSSNRTSQ